MAAVADGVAQQQAWCVAVGGSPLRRSDGEPEVVGVGVVLSACRPRRCRGRRVADDLAARWVTRGWKPFLHHISKNTPRPRRTVSLKAPKKLPRVLTRDEVQVLLDSCDRLRDRFLLALLYDTGMRIGEALGLRHSDITAAERQVVVCRRDNDNRARAKSVTPRTVPVSAELIRLYADYLHSEYGDLDSDYVFVNLWGRPHGHPLTYGAVYDLVRRLRRRTSIDFDPHWLRHTAATRMLRDGISLEVVAKLLGQSNVTVTATTCQVPGLMET